MRRGQIVVLLANQFFTLIPNELTETVRNFDVPSVAVYHRNELRLHFKLRGLQFLTKCFNNAPSPGGILCPGFVSNNARWSLEFPF